MNLSNLLSFRLLLRTPLKPIASVVLFALVLASSACGQRGPLYLPAPAGQTGKAAPQQLPAKTDEGVRNPPPNDSKTP